MVDLLLAGETDYEITGDRHVGHDLVGSIDELVVLCPGVLAVHRAQDPVRSALGRAVDIAADIGQVPHRGQDVVAEVGGVACDEPQAPQSEKDAVKKALDAARCPDGTVDFKKATEELA